MPDSAILLPPVEKHDYAAFGQTADPSALDAAILALPGIWGYWKLNEASGAPQDSSGNARHGSVAVSGMVYNQAAITSKCGPSVRFEASRFSLPTVIAHLSQAATGATYTIGGMFLIEASLGASSPAQGAYGQSFMSQLYSNAAYTDLSLKYGDYYTPVLLIQNGNGTLYTTGYNNSNAQCMVGLNKPLCVIVRAASLPGIVWSWDVFVNGVLCISQFGRSPTVQPPAGLMIGRSAESSSTYTKMRASNIFQCYHSNDVPMTDRQILNITQVYMDKAAYALSYTP